MDERDKEFLARVDRVQDRVNNLIDKSEKFEQDATELLLRCLPYVLEKRLLKAPESKQLVNDIKDFLGIDLPRFDSGAPQPCMHCGKEEQVQVLCYQGDPYFICSGCKMTKA